MRGKAATQNANRRTNEALERVAELERELRQVRQAAKREADALRLDLARARRDIAVEAGRLATEEIKRQQTIARTDARHAKMSAEISRALMYQKDRFIMNACRYLSMTRGEPPLDVIPMVMAWCTDEDFYGFGNDPVKWITRIGVPGDGWTARTVSRILKPVERDLTRRARSSGTPDAWSLDAVEDRPEEFSDRVHPKYKPKWYPRVKHQGIEVVDRGE